MYRLVRFYNQNRKTINRIILVIVFLFLILKVLNSFVKNKNKSDFITDNSNNITISNAVTSDKSVVTGKELNKNQITEIDVIEKFYKYCNSKEAENAYNLLSTDCKTELFPSIDEFKTSFFSPIFGNSEKLYTIENWVGSIYKIRISENILETGKEAKKAISDYVTVVKENNEYRLNIYDFIRKKTINKQKKFDDVEIKILNEYKYMDFNIFEIEITNNGTKPILLDDLNEIDNTYISDTNRQKYKMYTHEVTSEQLTIKPNSTTRIKLKFYCKYISTREIESITFNNVILNYKNDEKNTQYKIEIL